MMNIETAQQLLIKEGYDPGYLKIAPNSLVIISTYKKEKYINILKAFLILNPNWLSIIDPKEGNLVHIALQHSSIDFLKFVVENGVSISIKNKFNRTPLEHALFHKKYHHAKFLLFQEKEKNQKTYYKSSIFKYANHEIRQILLEWNYQLTNNDTLTVFGEVLMHLINVKDLNTSYYLDAYSDIDTVYEKYPIDLECFEYYLQQGANPNTVSTGQFLPSGTPLIFMATYFGFEKLVALLIQYGANIEATFPINNWTSWKYAKATKKMNIAKLLKQRGAKIYDLSKQAFIKAAKDNNLAKIKEELQKGININWKDQHGKTALYHAINNEHYGCANYLLDAGAAIHLLYNFRTNHKTILELTINKPSSSSQQILVQRLSQLK